MSCSAGAPSAMYLCTFFPELARSTANPPCLGAGVVGTSLKFHESSIADAKEAIQRVKQWWKRRQAPLQAPSMLFQETHAAGGSRC